MAPTISKMIGRHHPPPKKSFFVPRDPSQLQPEPESQPRERRQGTRRNYDQMQNGGGDVRLTPEDARSASTKAAFAAAGNVGEDTIVVDAPPGHDEFFSDDEGMKDIPEPAFETTSLSDAEKLEAIKRWNLNRQKHERKKRTKSSFVSQFHPSCGLVTCNL